MTIHPLLRLIATQPQLIADHAEAYAGLVGEEFGKSASAWKRRLALQAVALSSAAVSVVLGGIALMLWGAVPLAAAHSPWLLVAVPVVPALTAIACLLAAQRSDALAFSALKQQVAADLTMLREVGAAA